jgi:hypothetical protein
LAGLSEESRLTLRLFYTAAVLVQQQYADELRKATGEAWRPLPDLFSPEFGVPSPDAPIQRRLSALGQAHQRRTGIVANWSGTYDSVAHKLLRRWKMERRWSQSA